MRLCIILRILGDSNFLGLDGLDESFRKSFIVSFSILLGGIFCFFSRNLGTFIINELLLDNIWQPIDIIISSSNFFLEDWLKVNTIYVISCRFTSVFIKVFLLGTTIRKFPAAAVDVEVSKGLHGVRFSSKTSSIGLVDRL